MKKCILFIAAGAFALASISILIVHPSAQAQTRDQAQQEKKMPEVIVFGQSSTMGKVTFNHIKHNSGEYSVGGPIACIECHHTAQPASQLAKYPPLKTDWPRGRTTTLTAELFEKGPNAAGVAACRDCHARQGQVPKLIGEIPIVKDPGGTILTKLTNQLAFHQACDACHFQVSMNRIGTKVPNSTECRSCHKRAS